MALVNVTINRKAHDSSGNQITFTKTIQVDDTQTGGGTLPSFHRIGISSSRQGLSAGETHKRQACLDRHAEMAAQLGITAAAMRKLSGRHVYDQSNSTPARMTDIGVFNNCVQDGYGSVMLTSSTWSNHTAIANGTADTALNNFFNSVPNNINVVFNWEHEASNNAQNGNWPANAAEELEWRKGTARIAWLIWKLNKPNLHYTDCHIPQNADEAKWNWIPELKTLAPNDWQAVNARTYIGLDPYPEVGFSGGQHTLQTLQSKCGAALTYLRNTAGRTGPVILNEVGLYNWCIAHSEPYTLTFAQQAQRLHDELWTWGQKNRLLAYYYYDVSNENDADVRDTERTLNSPAELLEYAKLIRGDYY